MEDVHRKCERKRHCPHREEERVAMHLDSVYRDTYMLLRSEWSRAKWWSEGEKSMLLALDILRRQDYRLNITPHIESSAQIADHLTKYSERT